MSEKARMLAGELYDAGDRELVQERRRASALCERLNALFGPGVHVYTAAHPLSVAERRSGRELGKPVTIGDDVWLGGRVVVCPGVRIGSGSVVGAGSIVTRDVPAGVLAGGNPCRVIRWPDDPDHMPLNNPA